MNIQLTNRYIASAVIVATTIISLSAAPVLASGPRSSSYSDSDSSSSSHYDSDDHYETSKTDCPQGGKGYTDKDSHYGGHGAAAITAVTPTPTVTPAPTPIPSPKPTVTPAATIQATLPQTGGNLARTTLGLGAMVSAGTLYIRSRRAQL